MNARLTMFVAALAIAAIAVGCGSDEDSTSATDSAGGGSSSLSKAEFVKQAGAACFKEREDSFEEVAAYQEKHRSDGLPVAVLADNALKAVLLSTFEAEIAALRELEAPSGDEGEIEAILTAQEVALEKAKKRQAELSSEQVEGYFGAGDKELLAYGLGRCVKSG